MLTPSILFFAAVFIAWIFTFPLVKLLVFFRLGQPVREEGPATHRKKSGTPTMGGIGFILTIIILSLIMLDVEINTQYLALLILILSFALIGLIDDLLKVSRKENLGLSFWQKITSQTLFALVFSCFMVYLGHSFSVGGTLNSLHFSSPLPYFLLSMFIIVGSANAANLTDGLNGLLAGTAGIAFLAFSILAIKLNIIEAAIFASIAAGAVFSFLFFNFPKAEVFMGDVGSLALGAGLGGLAIILHKELLFILIGGVFVIETFSVILQVLSYKLFKRRIFKMAPLHHHFELMGFNETKVVICFWFVGIILGLIGILI